MLSCLWGSTLYNYLCLASRQTGSLDINDCCAALKDHSWVTFCFPKVISVNTNVPSCTDPITLLPSKDHMLKDYQI